MLHWFAGAKVQDTGDADATGYIEPPETPAPVFAVRAFKHAIFGTPATVQPKALRRHSNTESGKPRTNARPAMTRPKSSGDTHTLGFHDGAAVADPAPLPSPTKGILMTPGTAAARRKTVSFGAHVQDNEGKRQGKSGLPDSYPGKFPSPFVKSTQDEDVKGDAVDKARGRNRLTEKLEQAREESARKKSVSARPPAVPAKDIDIDSALDPPEPGPEHWKIVYEQYREKSERECRKLVSKQRAAKSFAREKDMQLLETADQLRLEKKRADRLERQVADLQEQLKEYQEKLRTSQAEEQTAKEENVRLKRGSGLTGYRRHGEVSTAAPSVQEKPARETALKTRTSRERLAAPDTKNNVVAETEDAPARPRYRSRNASKKEQGDLWAPSLTASSLIPTKPDPVPSFGDPRSGRTSTSASATPLASLSINTLPQESISVAMSMGLQPPSPQRETRSDSPMRPPRRSHPKPMGDLSISVPESSPFLPDAENERPNVLTGTPVPIRSPIRSKGSAVKENGSPTAKSARRPQYENLDPKNFAQVSVTELSEKDEIRRIAREMLDAGGRKVST